MLKMRKVSQQEVQVSTCVVPATDVTPAMKRISTDSERQLITRAKDGDEVAFAALFDAHQKRVYSICLRMTGNIAQAEDLTQDAFIQVFRKLGTFRGDSAFSTWLYRIAVNTVLMMFRKRDLRQISFDEPARPESSSAAREPGRNDPQLLGIIDRIGLIRAINELPSGYRRIFVLHEVEGYEHQEIARLLQCSVGNSKSQLHKARLKIRELLLADKRSTLRRKAGQKSSRNRGRPIPIITSPASAFPALTTRRVPISKRHREAPPTSLKVFAGWELFEGQGQRG
jgi:RNA polymerase sigma-70 factor (ECF subfamily)